MPLDLIMMTSSVISKSLPNELMTLSIPLAIFNEYGVMMFYQSYMILRAWCIIIFEITLNWIGAFESTCCPNLVAIVHIDIGLYCFLKVTWSYYDDLMLGFKLVHTFCLLVILVPKFCERSISWKSLMMTSWVSLMSVWTKLVHLSLSVVQFWWPEMFVTWSYSFCQSHVIL